LSPNNNYKIVDEASFSPISQIRYESGREETTLSDIIGDTCNGTASLKINNADTNLRLLNLNYINNETFYKLLLTTIINFNSSTAPALVPNICLKLN
jgi:hypothetical protein